ncbi:hypothetical protein D3C78_1480900 [compost metagenome]
MQMSGVFMKLQDILAMLGANIVKYRIVAQNRCVEIRRLYVEYGSGSTKFNRALEKCSIQGAVRRFAISE